MTAIAPQAEVARRAGRAPAEPTTFPQEVAAYIGTSNAEVIPLWDLDKTGAFDVPADAPEAEAFIIGQMADAVAELRDLIVLAWEQSATEPFGYPNVTVEQIEGGADAVGPIFGLDQAERRPSGPSRVTLLTSDPLASSRLPGSGGDVRTAPARFTLPCGEARRIATAASQKITVP